MDILTITCHDVYNVGASLQAYALMKYLEQCGHNVVIIDYKPNYLSKHYSLTTVNNKKYDKLGIKQLYLLAKLPGRVMCLFSKKKHNFDMFQKNYLKLTSIKYMYICGASYFFVGIILLIVNAFLKKKNRYHYYY